MYAPHEGEPPPGATGTEAMNGPAVWPWPFETVTVRFVSADGERTRVRLVHRDRGGQGAKVGLHLRDACAGLHVGVERNRDCREDPDDRDDDHQLDKGEASLVTDPTTAVKPTVSSHNSSSRSRALFAQDSGAQREEDED